MKNIKQQFNRAFKDGRIYRPLSENFLLDYFPNLRGEALDFGSGRGEASIILANRGLKVDALDFSEEAIKQQIKHKNISYILGNEFSIPNKKYDFILLKLVLAFIPKRKEFLKELKSHLKDGGQLLIISPIKRKGYNKHDNFISIDKKELESLKLIYKEYSGDLEIWYSVYRK